MKSQGAAKNEANNAAQKASAETAVKAEETKAAAAEEAAPAKVEIDFSNVEVEPLFEDMVDFDTFSKSDFRAVKVKECEAVPKSKKLLKFLLDDGSGTDRVILSGIHDYYEPEELVGKTLLAITNLPPRKMMGIDSCGMIISATHLVEGREGLNVLILGFFRNYPFLNSPTYLSFASSKRFLQRPYIVRFIIFNRLFVPSTKPLL